MKYIKCQNIIKGTWGLYRSDFKQGILRRWYYFVIVIPLILYLLIIYERNTVSVDEINATLQYSRTTMDYILHILKGTLEYRNGEFEIPVLFLTFNLIPALIVSYYPVNDFLDRGKVLFTRARTRASWWYSKCLWNITSVFIFYLVIYIVILLFSFANGKAALLPSESISLEEYGVVNSYTIFQYVAYEIILPIVTTMSLTLLQMTIAIIFSPVYGMVMQILVLFLSSFYLSIFLPGNYLMVIRNHLYRPDGIQFKTAIVICIVISFLSIVIGRIALERKDII